MQQRETTINNVFIKPPFNYTGCKFKLLPQLVPLFDYSRLHLVDLFTGGGSIWCNLAPYFQSVTVNDIIQDLIGIQKALLQNNHIIEETRGLCVAKHDKNAYHALRDSYNQQPTPAKLWALILCCNNNMMRFNRALRFNQTFGHRTWNESTTIKVANYLAHIRTLAPKIQFHSKDFAQVSIPPRSMVYVDPPYSNTEAGYNSYWGKNDDVRLFYQLQTWANQGNSIAVSGVENHHGRPCKLIDLLKQAGWQRHTLQADYNVVSKVGLKQTDEVVMTNYAPDPKLSRPLASLPAKTTTERAYVQVGATPQENTETVFQLQ